MSRFSLTRTRLSDGIWEGMLTRADDATSAPQIEALHQDTILDDVALDPTADGNAWHVRVALPVQVLSAGVQTILIRDRETEEILDSIAIIAGEALSEDIHRELALLRAELDLLKRAFRAHCNTG